MPDKGSIEQQLMTARRQESYLSTEIRKVESRVGTDRQGRHLCMAKHRLEHQLKIERGRIDCLTRQLVAMPSSSTAAGPGAAGVRSSRPA